VVPLAVVTRTCTVPAHEAGVCTRSLVDVERASVLARSWPK
jgi:hypothetical protein